MRKRPEKTEQTKAELREAFWRLYAERPIGAITVQQVCDLAGYNRGTFYLHFHDLYEVLEGIEEAQLDGMTSCVEHCLPRIGGTDNKLVKVAALTEVMRYYERNKPYIQVLLGQDHPDFIVRLKDRLKPLWREHVVGDASGRSEREIDLMLEYALSGALFMVARWLHDPGDVGPYEIGHLVYDTAIQAMEGI